MIAQSAPLLSKGHTYAMCIYTVGRRPLLSSSDSHLKFARFRKVRRKRRERLQFKIGQAMDFYLASDSSPAIHSKTTAKVIKRIGICKKVRKFLQISTKKLMIYFLNKSEWVPVSSKHRINSSLSYFHTKTQSGRI